MKADKSIAIYRRTIVKLVKKWRLFFFYLRLAQNGGNIVLGRGVNNLLAWMSENTRCSSTASNDYRLW